MNGNTKNPYVSVILPVYNEDVRLVSGLRLLTAYLKKQPYTWEILVVDDGSKVPVILPEYKHSIKVIRLKKNSGKGGAIRMGVFASKGSVVLFSDIDMSVPPEYIGFIVKKLKQFPVVITSRRHPQSKILVHQKRVREWSGRIFTWLAQKICGIKASDVTCGMKGFSRQAALEIFSKQRLARWVFDAEVLFLAKKLKLEVRQIPVVWTNMSGSKVKAFDGLSSLVDLLRIRHNDLRGFYEMRTV